MTIQYKVTKGDDWAELVDTLQNAIDQASGLGLPNNPSAVDTESAEIIDENVTVAQYVLVNAPSLSLGKVFAGPLVECASNSRFINYSVFNSDFTTGGGISFNGVDTSIVSTGTIAGGFGVSHSGASFSNLVKADAVAFTATGVSNTSTSVGEFGVDIGQYIFSAPNAVAINQDSSNCEMSVDGGIIVDSVGSGTKGLVCSAGVIDANMISINAVTAVETSGTGNIRARIGQVQGDIVIGPGTSATLEITNFDHSVHTVTNNGTLNGRIGDRRYGTWRISENNTINIESWQDAKDNLTPGDPSKSYRVFGKINATDNTSLDPNGAVVYGATDRDSDGFYSTQANHDLISSGKSCVFRDLTFNNSGAGSKTFSLNGDTGFEYASFYRCTFDDNTDIGTAENIYAWYETDISCNSNDSGLTLTDINFVVRQGSSFQQTNTANTQLALVGDFDLIKMINCGFGVPSGKTGLSVSGITSLSRDGVIDDATIFNGDGTYVDNLSVFDDPVWSVGCRGIDQVYKDIQSFGNLSKDAPSVTSIAASGTPVKITGSTTLGASFRMGDGSTDNRIVNNTLSRLAYTITGFASVDNTSGTLDEISVYVAIDGVADSASRSTTNVGSFLEIMACPINHTFYLDPGSYGELWIANDDDTTNLIVARMNYTLKA